MTAIPLLLLLGTARAEEPDVPRAEAIRSPDGAYVLTVYAPRAWTAAEIAVSGGDGVDVGAAAAGDRFKIKGYTPRSGPLVVTVRIATEEHVGITWEFSVDATPVPSRSPDLRRAEARPRKRWWRKG